MSARNVKRSAMAYVDDLERLCGDRPTVHGRPAPGRPRPSILAARAAFLRPAREWRTDVRNGASRSALRIGARRSPYDFRETIQGRTFILQSRRAGADWRDRRFRTAMHNPLAYDVARIRLRALDGYPELVERHGGDPTALLAEAGISPTLLGNPNATVEHDKVLAALELAAARLKLSDFGLRLAAVQSITALGPIALAARHAPTVEQALLGVIRLYPYVNPGTELRLEPAFSDGMARLSHRLPLSLHVPRRQNSELAMGIAVRFMRLISRSSSSNWVVALTHSKGLPPARYRRHFGCTARLGQESDAVLFPTAMLDEKIEASEPELADLATRFVTSQIRRFPLDLAKQIEALVESQVASGACFAPMIAQQLSLALRTMQRRLHSQGLEFEDIVDRVRRRRAEKLLSEPAIPLNQIHYLLGYTEQSTFIRSCSRWFGKTPGSIREEARKPSAGA